MKTVRQGLIEPGLVNRIMQLAFEGLDQTQAAAETVDSKITALNNATRTFVDVMVDILNNRE